MKTYGMPYKGSKNKIAERLIKLFPNADYFVDLFGGGGAMTDCAAHSGKYRRIIYNELNPVVYKGFVMAINGEFNNETRWITREDFQHLKDTDPYAAICFSFGNNLSSYAYSPENERIKAHVHRLLFSDAVNNARHEFRKILSELIRICKETNAEKIIKSLSSLQSLESLERLQKLRGLPNTECCNLPYEQVDIPDNSVIYCDIPYKNTKGYKYKFDYEKFYTWAQNRKNPIFISEYSMPENFTEIFRVNKTCCMGYGNSKQTVEKLFVNRAA